MHELGLNTFVVQNLVGKICDKKPTRTFSRLRGCRGQRLIEVGDPTKEQPLPFLPCVWYIT